MTTTRTTIVVPCYNEAERFDAHSFEKGLASIEDLHLLFVNDGSQDETLDRLTEFRSIVEDRVSILDLAQNVGKAEAVRQGMLQCLNQSTTDSEYVGYWDCDLATPIMAVREFETYMDNHPNIQVLLGARVRRLGAEIQRSVIRHYTGRVFATFAAITLGIPVYDTQCGAKLFRVGEYLGRVLEIPFVSKWAFDVELISRVIHADNGRIDSLAELPLASWVDVHGSKLSFSASVRAILSLYTVARKHRRIAQSRQGGEFPLANHAPSGLHFVTRPNVDYSDDRDSYSVAE